MAQANELRHVAVILDGNGRWAAQHGVERKEGHLAGANRVVDFMNYISRYDSIRYVTLYAFSTENWKRSKEEVDALMNILAQFLDDNLEVLLKEKLVAAVPGKAFGGEGHIRLSYATSDEVIKQGVARLKEFMKELK